MVWKRRKDGTLGFPVIPSAAKGTKNNLAGRMTAWQESCKPFTFTSFSASYSYIVWVHVIRKGESQACYKTPGYFLFFCEKKAPARVAKKRNQLSLQESQIIPMNLFCCLCEFGESGILWDVLPPQRCGESMFGITFRNIPRRKCAGLFSKRCLP